MDGELRRRWGVCFSISEGVAEKKRPGKERESMVFLSIICGGAGNSVWWSTRGHVLMGCFVLIKLGMPPEVVELYNICTIPANSGLPHRQKYQTQGSHKANLGETIESTENEKE